MLIQTDGSQSQHTAHPSDAEAPRPPSPRAHHCTPNQDRDTGLARRGGTSKQHNPALQCSTRTKKSSKQASVLPPPAAGAYKLPRRSRPGGQIAQKRRRHTRVWRQIPQGSRLALDLLRSDSLFLPSILRHVYTHVYGSWLARESPSCLIRSLVVVALKRSETSTRRPEPP